MSDQTPGSTGVPRRSVVALAGAGAALPLLAACGGGGTIAKDPQPATQPSAGGTGKGGSGGSPAQPLAATGDIPVGGGKVFSTESVVVTQPKAGEFRCFSSVCTHQGCTVAAGATLDCPCHGSRYSITDGSVLNGPAPRALPEKQISVKAATILPAASCVTPGILATSVVHWSI